MSRITAQEVLEAIQNNNGITKDQLADFFEVSSDTIAKRVSELRDDSEKILHNSDGYFYLGQISTNEEAKEFEKYSKWIMGMLKGIAKCGKITKPLLLQSREYIKTQLTKQERKMLTNYTSQVSRIISAIDLEDELES